MTSSYTRIAEAEKLSGSDIKVIFLRGAVLLVLYYLTHMSLQVCHWRKDHHAEQIHGLWMHVASCKFMLRFQSEIL